MINFSLPDTFSLAQNLIKSTVSHVIRHNSQDLENLDRKTENFKQILDEDWKIITYTKAKSITKKNEIGLSTEEEKFLTVFSIKDTHFNSPVIVTNYPAEITPFYMKKNQGFAENFDLLFPGVGEIVGGSVREENFDIVEERIRDKKGLDWYLELRKYGTVPHAGFGLGFERLLLYITGLSNVRDIIPVPRTPKNLLC